MSSTTWLLSSLSSFFNPLSNSSSKSRTLLRYKKNYKVYATSRSEGHDSYNSRLVDENMIVLRKKIHEMKMVERNYEPPAEWMKWEKRYYTSYDSIICQIMGVLQSRLMDTRPSLAITLLALVGFSVPFSTVTVISHLLDITKGF